ncbi:MAG: hypothetical protein ROW52_06240 [Anaerolineaceae bacterium]|jgi:hypothetical protein
MAKQDQKQKQKKTQPSREQRRIRVQQIFFAFLAALIILSFIITAVVVI